MRWFVMLCTAAVAMAAEAQLDDLRLVAEVQPTAYTSTWEDRLGSREDDGAFDAAWAVGVGWRRGWGAAGRPGLVLVGVEAVAIHESTPGTVSNGQALRLEAGVGLALNHHLTFTLMPLIGYGRMVLNAEPAAAGRLTVSGPLQEFGVRAGVRWSINDRWSVAAEAGWLRDDQRLSGDDATLRMISSGTWAGLSLAWIIDPLPKALE